MNTGALFTALLTKVALRAILFAQCSRQTWRTTAGAVRFVARATVEARTRAQAIFPEGSLRTRFVASASSEPWRTVALPRHSIAASSGAVAPFQASKTVRPFFAGFTAKLSFESSWTDAVSGFVMTTDAVRTVALELATVTETTVFTTLFAAGPNFPWLALAGTGDVIAGLPRFAVTLVYAAVAIEPLTANGLASTALKAGSAVTLSVNLGACCSVLTIATFGAVPAMETFSTTSHFAISRGAKALPGHVVTFDSGRTVAPRAALLTVEARGTGKLAEGSSPTGTTGASSAHDVTEGVGSAFAPLTAVTAIETLRTR